MKRTFLALLILTALCTVVFATVATPWKFSTVPKTSVYWGKGGFAGLAMSETLIFSSARGFRTAGDSTAILATGLTTTGTLSGSIMNDSTFIIKSSVDTDSNKTYWYMLIHRVK